MSTLVRVYQFRDRKGIYCYDISVTQCYTLTALVHAPLTLKLLSEKLYLDKSTASRVVDSLERERYVRRISDPDDARTKILKVTEKGRKLHQQIEQDLVQEMKKLINPLDSEVRQATARLISRLARSASNRFINSTKNTHTDFTYS